MSSAIRRVRRVAEVAALVLVAAGSAAGQAAAQDRPSSGAAPGRSTLTGAFTVEQAAAGEAVFKRVCGSCHPTSQFTGPEFQRAWSGRPVFALFDQLRMMMPMDNPGGLSNEEYAAVIAYILKLNRYPAADEPLPADDAALKRVLFEKHPDTDS